MLDVERWALKASEIRMKTFPFEWTRRRAWFALGVIGVVALLLRTSGLFRGLEAGYVFHEDEPKQIVALWHFLEGRYVWYVGNPFYDGYPVALNHVDEWLLRPVFAVRRVLEGLLFPDEAPGPQPGRLDLFYWARSLRVIYGLCGLALAYAVARRLWSGRGAALAAVALVAVAPLLSVVTHSATGDIGTDLFTALALLFLCPSLRAPQPSRLAAVGMAVGLAFACKYNGALAGLAVALFLLVQWLGDRDLVRTLRSGAAVAAGFLAGVLVGVPAFWIDRQRTWRDMRIIFGFIRDYGLSPEFKAKPAWERMTIALAENTPATVSALGWTLTLLALAGLIWAAARLRRGPSVPAPSDQAWRQRRLEFAVLAFPFVALLVSLVGKPAVQPFHFSYLQLPLTLGAVFALRRLWLRPGRWGRGVAGVLFVVALAELGWGAGRERFFWARGDTLRWKELWPGQVFDLEKAPAQDVGVVKNIHLEPSGGAVFRNRMGVVEVPGAGFWNRLHMAPVPDVPGSVDPDWIFPNGPVFPRNDRTFKVARDSTATRQVVFHAEPGEVTLGLRSGSWPVAVELDYGDRKQSLVLAPHDQQTLRVSPRRWRRIEGTRKAPAGSFLVPLTVRAQTGAAWVTVMTDERETHLFDLFGGKIADRARLRPEDVPSQDVIRELERMRYLEGDEHLVSSADHPTGKACRFPGEGVALPCGSFRLRCEIRVLSPDAEATITLTDFRRCLVEPVFSETVRLSEGLQVVTCRFSKVFAPYEGQFELVSSKGTCRVERWSLVPDAARMREDLRPWLASGTVPAWVGRGTAPVPVRRDPALRFGNRIRLTHLDFPATVRKKEKIPIFCAMELDRFGWPHLGEYFLFIHLLNRDGHTVSDFHFSVEQVMAQGSMNKPFWCEPLAGLPAGEYSLEVGVYSGRTEQRLSLQGEGLSRRERAKRVHVFGKTTVTE
jgi:4-amino-4-deoxy-L-arabinose transferase-like glycosyltransferase